MLINSLSSRRNDTVVLPVRLLQEADALAQAVADAERERDEAVQAVTDDLTNAFAAERVRVCTYDASRMPWHQHTTVLTWQLHIRLTCVPHIAIM